jgi:CRISPR/Cas system-associated protein Cas7 (RAMP superfamily)
MASLRLRNNAVRYPGIYVNNYDAEKAKMNNNVFRKALINGYKPFTAKRSAPNERRDTRIAISFLVLLGTMQSFFQAASSKMAKGNL